jgi:hypothetical protein
LEKNLEKDAEEEKLITNAYQSTLYMCEAIDDFGIIYTKSKKEFAEIAKREKVFNVDSKNYKDDTWWRRQSTRSTYLNMKLYKISKLKEKSAKKDIKYWKKL